MQSICIFSGIHCVAPGERKKVIVKEIYERYVHNILFYRRNLWTLIVHTVFFKIRQTSSNNGLVPSTLVDIWLVAWTAPSHYLNQCWNTVNWTIGNKLQWNFNRNPNIFIQENAFENVGCEIASILSRPHHLGVSSIYVEGYICCM